MIQNAAIDDQIRALPEKMGVSHLYDKELSSKNQTVYTPANENDKKRLEEYHVALQKLQASKIRTPDFNTQLYSIFRGDIQGAGDEMHLVYPEKPSLELYTILSTFREVCGK